MHRRVQRRWLGMLTGLACVGFMTLATRADQATPPVSENAGLVLGHVVDGTTNRAVPGAVVSIAMTGGGAGAAFKTLPVAADSDGRFFFRDLPKGQFQLTATAMGYAQTNAAGARRPGGTSQAIELVAGQKLNDVTIAMWRPAEINGVILDDAGEPWPNAQVAAMPVNTAWGQVAFGPARGDTSDDRGFFRITGLSPGRYVVFAASTVTTAPTSFKEQVAQALGNSMAAAALTQSVRGSGALFSAESGILVGDVVVAPVETNSALLLQSSDGSIAVSRTTYYANADTPKGAARVELAAGEVRSGVQLQAQMAATTAVSGTLVGPKGPLAHFGVRLMPAGLDGVLREDGFWASMTLTDARGVFLFAAVPPGSYVLKATWFPTPMTVFTQSVTLEGAGGVITSSATGTTVAAPAGTLGDHTYFASQPITVGDRPIRDLAVTLREAPKAGGRIRFEGTTPPPTAEQLARGAMTFDMIDTRPMGFRPSPKAVIDPSASFQVEGLIPSRYAVTVTGFAGWTLKSALVKGRDISDEPFLVSGDDIADIEVTLTDQPASIAGVVRDASGAPDASADVMVFSADDAKRSSPRRQTLVRASRAGTYAVNGLPPGDYYVAAVDDRLTAEWPSPSFLEALARVATRVSTDGGARTLDLRTIVGGVR